MGDKNGEQLLIDKIRSGDPKAERQVYLDNKEYFLGFISSRYPLLAEKDVHLDVYQEVMIIFYKNVKSGKLTRLTSKIITYLTNIGLYQINNIVRKLNREQKFLNEFEASEFTQNLPLIDIEEREVLEKELIEQLDKLDDTCREIIRLSFFDLERNSDIGKKLGLTSKKVAQKKWLCLEKLRNLFHKNFKPNE